MPVAQFREAVRMIRSLCRGDKVDYQGRRFTRGYGGAGVGRRPRPRVMELAGAESDGLILQLAAPSVVQWSVGHARKEALWPASWEDSRCRGPTHF
jgi:alkanesulfonate monooxygenase SsuD/methylene tetrahydromethanopterin reductase-like flavin-dependent oxidoreductase (luciferase family)